MTKKTEDLELIIFKANLSEHARFVIENFLSELKFNNKKKFDKEKLLNWIYSTYEFCYTSDAYNYLMDENKSDLTEAVNAGCTQIHQIAEFYLQQELLDEIYYKL